MSDDVKRPENGWLIHKAHRGWYRPNAQGYTAQPSQAGRYSYTDALAYSHPNGHDGPRDGLTIVHESDLPAPADPKDAEIAYLSARLAEAERERDEAREALEKVRRRAKVAEKWRDKQEPPWPGVDYRRIIARAKKGGEDA